MVFLPAGAALLIDTSGFRMLLLSFAFTDRCKVSKKAEFFHPTNKLLPNRFWNTLTGQPMQSVDTGSQVFSNNFYHYSLKQAWSLGQIIYILSQVCNLAWSKHASELVSTHGYSQNQILVWKYPSLVQVGQKSFRSIFQF